VTAEVESARPPPLVAEDPAPSQKRKPPKLRRSQIEIGVVIVLTVIAAYALSLFGIHILQTEGTPLTGLDLSQGGGNATIVQLRVEELKPDVLGNDVAVRLYPANDLGDLRNPKIHRSPVPGPTKPWCSGC
jgi:hypothetical protein